MNHLTTSLKSRAFPIAFIAPLPPPTFGIVSAGLWRVSVQCFFAPANLQSALSVLPRIVCLTEGMLF